MLFGKYINRYYLKYSWVLFFGTIALLAVDIFQLHIPELYGRVVDALDPSTPSLPLTGEELWDICRQMLIIAGVMVSGRFLWRTCFFGTANRVECDLREKMFDKSRFLTQRYYQENKVGGLMSLFTNDLDTINECYGNGILMFFDALTLGTLALYKMAKLNLSLMLFTLIPISLMAVASITVGHFMKRRWKARQEAFSGLSDFAQESFSGVSVIKAFVREASELSSFSKRSKRNEEANVAYTKISVLLNVTIILFVQSVICVVLGYGGYLTFTGEFSVAELIMFISYYTSTVWPIMAVSQLIEMTSRGKASLDRITELLDEVPEIHDCENAVDKKDVKGEITYKNLTFQYPDGEFPVLEGVSFTVHPGEQIGVIGKTGAGKTTLLDLMMRTYPVDDGSIFIDGTDINQMTLRSLRGNIAYVPQDNFLFSDTIAHNIAFSTGGEADRKDIEKVGVLAALDSNVKDFPDGYDTVLGERGVTISGGQKQRTSIARALLKDAPILILDDAVSAVDTGTEKQILEGLRTSRKGKTTFLIAHRISTVENLDRILYLEDGKLVDIGTHKELVSRCSAYKNLVELQKLEDEIGGMNA